MNPTNNAEIAQALALHARIIGTMEYKLRDLGETIEVQTSSLLAGNRVDKLPEYIQDYSTIRDDLAHVLRQYAILAGATYYEPDATSKEWAARSILYNAKKHGVDLSIYAAAA